MSDMIPSDSASEPTPEAEARAAIRPAELRFLKVLVASLAVTMIVGLVAIVGLLVTRLGVTSQPGPLPVLPATIHLPEGARAEAVTVARDYTLVVTDAQQVLLFRPDGTLAQTIAIAR